MRIKTKNIDVELSSTGLFAGVGLGRLSLEAFIDRTGQGLSTVAWGLSEAPLQSTLRG